MLAAASLVLLMTPALAFFYGGMTRSKTVLNMMMMSFGALAVVGSIWMLWGYSMTFGTNIAGIFGDPFEYFGLHNLTDDGSLMAATGVPATVAVGYQADLRDHHRRADQRCHRRPREVRHLAGLQRHLGHPGLLRRSPTWCGAAARSAAAASSPTGSSTPIDFAGGTVVHINAGMAGFMLAIIIGKRRASPRTR